MSARRVLSPDLIEADRMAWREIKRAAREMDQADRTAARITKVAALVAWIALAAVVFLGGTR